MMVDAHLYPPESGAFAFLSQEQWGPLPWWVMLELHHLARNGRHEAARLFFAHYELWALAINSYSSLTHGNLLPGVFLDTALFHSLPPEHLRSPMFSPFPLLPLSQDYSRSAALQALEALKVLISLRLRYENPQEQKRLGKVVEEANLAYLDWQHRWSTYPLARRQDLSRSLWNTFALVLEGQKIPSVNTVFFTATAPMASVGAARPSRLSDEQEHLFHTLAKDVQQGQEAFEDTVGRICKYLVEHYPHAVTWIIPAHRSLPEDYYVACFQHLHAVGGLAALSVENRFRLLVELFLVYHDLLGSEKSVMASPDQIFECIKETASVPPPRPISLSSPVLPSSHHFLHDPLAPHSVHNHEHGLAPPSTHSLGRRSALSPNIGLRTAARLGTTPEEWAQRAMRRAY